MGWDGPQRCPVRDIWEGGAAVGSLSAFVLPPRSECLFFYTFFLLLRGPCVCFCALCPRVSVSVCPRCVCLCCLSLSVLVTVFVPFCGGFCVRKKDSLRTKVWNAPCETRCDAMRCRSASAARCRGKSFGCRGVCGKDVRGVLVVWYRGVQA